MMTDWRDVINPKSKFTKVVRNDLAERGHELTPDQLVSEQKIILEKLRTYLRKKGHQPPESNQEMFNLVMRAMKNQKERT